MVKMGGDGSGCGVNYFCLGAVFIFVGSVLLCALGFTIVLPHQATRSWERVTCNITNSTYHPTMCSCNHQSLGERICLRRFPCLLVSAVYRTTGEIQHNAPFGLPRPHVDSPGGAPSTTVTSQTEESHDGGTRSGDATVVVLSHTAVASSGNVTDDVTARAAATNDVTSATIKSDIMENPTAARNDGFHWEEVTSGYEAEDDGKSFVNAVLYNTWSDAFYEKCALNECGAEEWNIKETEKFRKENGIPGQTPTCYIKPDDPTVVILARTPYSHMIHAIVWPVVSLSFGITLWLGLCLGCWKMDKEFEPVALPKPRQYGLL